MRLRPVERTVCEPDQLVARDARTGEGREARAHGHRAELPQLEIGDALDARAGRRERLSRVGVRKQEREFVAAEPEALAALTKPRGDLRQDAVAGRMAVQVVHPLEVVDVEEGERNRRPLLLRVVELSPESLLEVAVVAEPRERIGQGQPDRLELPVRRPLVERDRQQRPDERGHEQRRPLPEHDDPERGGGHDRERQRGDVEGVADRGEERSAGAPRDDGGDEDHVDRVVRGRRDRDGREGGGRARSRDEAREPAGNRGGEAEL